MTLINLKRTDPTFESLVNDFFGLMNNVANYDCNIKSNVSETSDKYILDLILAGYNKEDVKINIENNVLIISADIKEEKNEETEKYHRCEFNTKSFVKKYSIPEDVNQDQIKAKHENGILKVELFKNTVQPKAKNINID